MPDVISGPSEQREEPGAASACRIVFVCTGNTCRSPLAQALCVKLLAERLGCSAADLPARGYVVESGGLATWPGLPASPEAVDVGRALGVDLSAHESRPLTAAVLIQASCLVAMTQSHVETLKSYEIPGAPQ